MGIATIQARTNFQLRIDPEAISFEYTLNTATQQTYGGKVVQILSVSISDMAVPCVAGAGGRTYLSSVVKFFKETMIWQRDSQNVAKFVYPPLNYQFDVFASALTIEDELANVVYPYTMSFKIRQTIGGYKTITDSIIDAEMKKLVDGIGYVKNKYNDPDQNTANTKKPTDPGGTSTATAAQGTGTTNTNPSTPQAPPAATQPGGGGVTSSSATTNPGSGGSGAPR